MRGGKIGGKRFRCGHDDDGITSITIRKLKASSDRCRSPRLLWVPPVDPGQKITELRRRDRHHTLGRARPDEAAPLQTFREQAGALAVMPDHLQQIAATTAEAEQMAAQWVAMQVSPEPAMPATESLSACRCSRSRARPARRSATGSSRPSISQRRHDGAQRRRIDRARDPHPSPARELNLDRTAGLGGRRQRLPVWRKRDCRKTDFVILPLHRPRPESEDARARLPPPNRDQIAVNIMSSSNLDNTGPRRQNSPPRSEASRQCSTAVAAPDRTES